MEKLIVSLAFPVVILMATGVSFAQEFPPGGTASLTIKMDGVERAFAFPDELPTLLTAVEHGSDSDRYTDIDFSREFEKDQEYVLVHIRIQPSGTGSFVIPPPDGPAPPRVVGITVSYHKNNANGDIVKELQLSSDPDKGVQGGAEVTRYGPVGTDLVGSFQATLRDIHGGNPGGLYQVKGSFKVKQLGKS